MIERTIAFVLGAWILLSPWFFGASANSLMLWSNTLVGLALVLVNIWALFGEQQLPPPSPEQRELKKAKKVERVSMIKN